MDELVRYEQRGHVALLTFNRPDRLNALTPEMHEVYRELLARAEATETVGTIVVTGAGRGFCAGADATALDGLASGGGGPPFATPTRSTDRPGHAVHPDFDRPFAYHLGLAKPVIAAINGPTVGLGLVLACYCDVRFADTDAMLTTGFGPLALPVEFGLSWMLPRLIGGSRAVELLLSSRRLGAEEAERIGLVHRVLPPDELVNAAVAYGEDMATGCAPGAVTATKRQVYLDLRRDLGEAYTDALLRTEAAIRTPDFREGVSALGERRRPRFGTHRADGAS
jgi:enoyl-CoA hydratase/carnithine racemase